MYNNSLSSCRSHWLTVSGDTNHIELIGFSKHFHHTMLSCRRYPNPITPFRGNYFVSSIYVPARIGPCKTWKEKQEWGLTVESNNPILLFLNECNNLISMLIEIQFYFIFEGSQRTTLTINISNCKKLVLPSFHNKWTLTILKCFKTSETYFK